MKKNIVISEGVRPFWQLIIAAIFYTIGFICMYLFFMKIDLYAPSVLVRNTVSLLEVVILMFFTGFGFSVTKDFYFDFERRKYKPVFRVGPIKVGKWINFKKINYIAVFKNTKSEYEVNIWYDANKHLYVALFSERNTAIQCGKDIALQLKLDVYDATNRHDKKWISLQSEHNILEI